MGRPAAGWHPLPAGAGALAALLLIACGRADPPGPPPPTVENPLLRHVPADTPYLAANLQAPPEAAMERMLERVDRLLAAVAADAATAPAAPQAGAGFRQALHDELQGRLDRDSLERLGLDLRAPRVVYGWGAFPVLRLALSDAGRLRAAIGRILERGQVPAAALTHEGRPYWRLAAPLQAAAGPGPVLYFAVLDDQFVAGLMPGGESREVLDHLLGPAIEPAGAAARLVAANQRFGFTLYGSGEVDLLRLAGELFDPTTRSGRLLGAAGIDLAALLGTGCPAELRALLAKAPRVYGGLTEFETAALGYRLIWEMKPALAKELTGLVAAVPAVDPQSMQLLELQLGLRVDAVREFLRARVAALAAQPFQCARLATLNAGTGEAYVRLNQPLLPMLGNLRGARLSLSEISVAAGKPADGAGVLAIHVKQPEVLIGMAQMFLPGLADLPLVSGAPPVRLPADMLPLPGAVVHAAVGVDAIGLAVGAGEVDRLGPFLAATNVPTGTFLSVAYDTARYLDYRSRLPLMPAAEAASATAAARAAYRAMAGRTFMSLRFSNDGLTIDNRVTFQ